MALDMDRRPAGDPGRTATPDDAAALLSGYRRWLIVGDALLITFAVIGAVVIRFRGVPWGWYWFAPLVAPALWVGMLALARTYETRFLASGSQETERVVRAGLGLFTLVAVGSYSLGWNLSRGIVLVAVPSAVIGALLLRWLLRRRLHQTRRQGKGLHRVVVVGRRDAAESLVISLQRASHRGLEPVGICIPEAATLRSSSIAGTRVLGDATQVLEAVDATGADTVAVVSHPDLSGNELRRLSWALEERGVELIVSPGIVEVAGPRLSIRPVAGLSMLHVESPAAHSGKMLLKATFDRSVGIVLLIMLAPLLFALGVLVRLTSRGPALLQQRMIGGGGREFVMLKLRTTTDPDDPESVTPLGARLRRYSIDELPQLLNVARGEMSLVGPRPPKPDQVAQWDSDAARRLRVRPGMTGLWQVSGRHDLTWDESLRLDLRYVDNWSIGMDLIILWRTVSAVISGTGAY